MYARRELTVLGVKGLLEIGLYEEVTEYKSVSTYPLHIAIHPHYLCSLVYHHMGL